ncbi:Oligosaccaryltransferase-domain-containing protein [Boeremia exigua]|uniref:Oligosaccaryltransferase-domain-containing protein n=1 Tax=Boeremia exigua TaxID=749465 RepID=UPI001E8E5B26|nr:Oligosaccaryltransferase-domain-containing protein [Boeremia exigua]KAH6615345.1 Oligosaccaryltransferase-domain-containing protein [Boeremia exigua]
MATTIDLRPRLDIPAFASHGSRTTALGSDAQLYSLAIFLGSAAMLLIVLYHFLEVNSEEHAELQKPKPAAKVKA